MCNIHYETIRRIAICVVLLASLYGITESQVEVCFQQNDMGMMGEICTCSSPPPMLPSSPSFCLSVLPSSTTPNPTTTSTLTTSTIITTPSTGTTTLTPSTDTTVLKPTTDTTMKTTTLTPSTDTIITRTTDTSILTPSTDTTILTLSTDTTILTPSTDTSIFTPSTDTTILTPSTDTTNFTPSTDSTVLTPSTDTSISTPTTDTSILTPSTDTSILSPSTDTTILTPSTDTSILTPSIDTTILTPSTDTTILTPSTDTSILTPSTDTTNFTPSTGTTILTPSTDTTILIPSTDTTILTPSTDTTIITRTTDTSILTPSTDTTILTPSTDTSILIPSTDTTIITPSTDTTILTPSTGTTTLTSSTDTTFLTFTTDTTISSPTPSTATTTTTSAPTSQSEPMSTSTSSPTSSSPSSPTGKNCTVPDDVTVNDVVICQPGDTVVSGTSCTFGCENIEGTITTICTAEGTWEPEAPTCGNCIVPDDVTVNDVVICQPGDTVVSGTSCTFGCENIEGTITTICTAKGTWEPEAPTCGTLGAITNVIMSSISTDNATGRKRRDVLPTDNAAVLIVQETYELTILRINTTYLVNSTTVSAQNSINDILQMNLLFGIMYRSDINVEFLIKQVEAALRDVKEFTVNSVIVLDLDTICSSSPCENDAECTVDYNNLNFTCSCAVWYSGRLCSDSSSVLLIAVFVPIFILIVAFTIFIIVLLLYCRARLHHYKMGMKNKNSYHDVMQQLFFTEDKTPGYHDQGTWKNSILGLRFSKEINAHMRERSQQMELQAQHPFAVYNGPADRHRRQTDHVRNGRGLSNGQVTGAQALQTFHPNGIHSRDIAYPDHMVVSSNAESKYNRKTPRYSSRGNYRN